MNAPKDKPQDFYYYTHFNALLNNSLSNKNLSLFKGEAFPVCLGESLRQTTGMCF